MKKNVHIYLCEAILAFFGFFYANMKVDLFWSNIISYLNFGNYGYNFMLSTEMGLFWLYIPILAFFINYYDGNFHLSKKKILTGIMHFSFAYILFILLLVCFSKKNTPESTWQIVAINHLYGNLATNENMPLFTLFCYIRLITVLFLWQLLISILQTVLLDISVVFVLSISIFFLWHVKAPIEWRYSYWQIPYEDNMVPMRIMIFNYFIVICVSLIILFGKTKINYKGKLPFFSKSGNANGKKFFLTKQSVIILLLCGFVPVLITTTTDNIILGSGGFIDKWFALYSGIEWGHPEVIEEYAFGKLFLINLPMIVMSSYMLRKLENSVQVPFYKTIANLMLNIFVIMALIPTISCLFEYILYGKKTLFDNSTAISVCIISGIMYFFQVLISVFMHWITYKVTKNQAISLITWFTPYIITLLTSNEDRLYNKYSFINWSMIMRSNLFSPSYIDTYMVDGTIKRYELCTFSPFVAVVAQIFLCVCLLIVLRKICTTAKRMITT